MSESEVNKEIRKSLKTLQRSTASRENFLGKVKKTSKHHLSQESSLNQNIKRRSSNKEIQVNLDDQISEDDLTNPDGASKKYWQVLAEKRQVALQEVLEENHKLRTVNEDLKKQLDEYKQMLDEANSFVEVIKEELANCSKDDTGIDVNDFSTADESAADESATVENNTED